MKRSILSALISLSLSPLTYASNDPDLEWAIALSLGKQPDSPRVEIVDDYTSMTNEQLAEISRRVHETAARLDEVATDLYADSANARSCGEEGLLNDLAEVEMFLDEASKSHGETLQRYMGLIHEGLKKVRHAPYARWLNKQDEHLQAPFIERIRQIDYRMMQLLNPTEFSANDNNSTDKGKEEYVPSRPRYTHKRSESMERASKLKTDPKFESAAEMVPVDLYKEQDPISKTLSEKQIEVDALKLQLESADFVARDAVSNDPKVCEEAKVSLRQILETIEKNELLKWLESLESNARHHSQQATQLHSLVKATRTQIHMILDDEAIPVLTEQQLEVQRLQHEFEQAEARIRWLQRKAHGSPNFSELLEIIEFVECFCKFVEKYAELPVEQRLYPVRKIKEFQHEMEMSSQVMERNLSAYLNDHIEILYEEHRDHAKYLKIQSMFQAIERLKALKL